MFGSGARSDRAQAVDCQRDSTAHINFLHRSVTQMRDRVIWARRLFTGRRMRLGCHLGAIGAIGRVQVSDKHTTHMDFSLRHMSMVHRMAKSIQLSRILGRYSMRFVNASSRRDCHPSKDAEIGVKSVSYFNKLRSGRRLWGPLKVRGPFDVGAGAEDARCRHNRSKREDRPNCVVLQDIPPGATAVGISARCY